MIWSLTVEDRQEFEAEARPPTTQDRESFGGEATQGEKACEAGMLSCCAKLDDGN
jgi:hypothetical protein